MVSASASVFADTNVLVYLLSADGAKAERAEAVLALRPVISVQVLNEFAQVASRKLGMRWREVADALADIRSLCAVRPLTVEVHDLAVLLVQRHALAWCDALIVAAALDAGCRTLYTEDLQHGQRIGRSLTVRNPFLPA